MLCFLTAWQPTPLYAQSGPICYGVTDGAGNSEGVDTLVSLDVVTGDATTIGETATVNIEAIAFSADGQTLYASDAERFGTLDLATGAYTNIGAYGSGNGAEGEILFNDVDGLTFDITTNTLFGSLRRADGPADLLFKINPATGAIIPDGFGAGVDYVVVPLSSTDEHDIDDLAADPYTGILYGVINNGGAGGTLATIDKATGAITELGLLGSSDIEGLGFARDGVVGTLYGSTGDNGPIEADNNDLYQIDKANGGSTLIDGLPETETLRDYESLDCIFQAGNIGDTIWSDDDQDGDDTVNGDDVVLPNIDVNLLDSNGTVVATQTTDANGNYLFENVSFGTYTVQVDTTTLPPIKQGNPAYDPDGGDDNQSTVTISVDDPNNFEQDFAYFQGLGVIGDTIFHDANGDGVLNTADGDFPLPDVTVTLTDENDVTQTAVTDADGNYLFTDLPLDATYTVVVDTATLPDSKITTPSADPDGVFDSTSEVTLTPANPEDLDQDFGYEPELGSIGDTIFHDANGDGVLNTADGDFVLEGVTVTLTDENDVTQTAVTDGSGNYLFTDLPLDATYTVVVDTATLPDSKITTPSADPDGVFDSTSEVTLTPANPDDLDQDFGYEPELGSIGDTIFHDANGDGVLNTADGDFVLEGVTVTLTDENDVTQTAVTDGSGNYLFTDLPLDATYTVVVDTATLPDSKITTPSADPDGVFDSTSEVTLTPANPDDLDQDFGYEPELGSIGDTIFHDANGDGVLNTADGDFPLPGVTVTLTDENDVTQTAVTDGSGNYLFTDLPLDATYTVVVDTATLPDSKITTPSADPDGVFDSTSEVTLTVANPDDLDQDFGYEPELGTIGDTIFHDANGDGVFNTADGDFLLPDVTVALSDESGTPIGTAVTDADGNYLFTDLPLDATYTVVVDTATLPDGKITDPTADPDGVLDSTSEVTLTVANPSDLDQDFGYQPETGSIGDTIFHDANSDGVFNTADGDFALDNVRVTLTDADDNVQTAVTDADGNYLFTDLPLDATYTVIVDTTTLPDGKLTDPTADPDGVLDSTSEVTLTLADPDDLDQDFGYEPVLGSIGDTIWHDDDQDGNSVIDGDDRPIEGVTVNLLDSSGAVVATAETNADGQYLFENLAMGDYVVQIDTLTLPIAKQGNPAYDPDGGNDNASVVALTPENPDNLDQDFAYFAPAIPTGSIGDTIFHDDDQDGNGLIDGDDRPIAGVVVNLLDSTGAVVATDTTDDNGAYLFEEVPYGTYTVQVDTNTLPVAKQGNPAYDPDGGNDNVSSVTINEAAPDNLDQDFAYFTPEGPTGSIGDTIFHDDDQDGNGVVDGDDRPIAGVVVNLLDSSGAVIATDTTDDNGAYLFEEVPYGTYTIQVDTNTLPVAKQGNPAYDPDGGDDNVSSVTLNDANPDDLDQDFAYFAPSEPTGSIGDTIFHDDDQDGNGVVDGDDEPIAGVVVNLLDSSGAVVATDTTDDNGAYLFENVPFGSYTVQVDTSTLPAEKQGNPAYDPDGGDDNQSAVTVDAANPNNLEQDFAYFAPAGSIGDTIFHDANGDGVFDPAGGDFPLPGITVTLTDADGNSQTAVTNATGGYSFVGLPLDATYTVVVDTATLPASKIMDPTADPDGDGDSTSTVTLTPSAPENNDQDFGYTSDIPVGSIGDTIFHDENSDGLFNPVDGDFPLPDVTVTLTDAAGATQTTTTDENGNYLFANLPLGDYSVIVDTATLPVGKLIVPTADPDGNADSVSNVTLTEGAPNNTDQDFGYESAPTASIGNYVWLDRNVNGSQESNEPGLEGVTVYLLDSNSNVLDTTTTDANGFYLFEGLTPGDYAIRADLPTAGYVFSPQDQTDDNFDSDVNEDTGISVVTTLEADENDTSWDIGISAPPNLNVEKNASGASFLPGDNIVYSISYFNSGVGEATGVILQEQVPADMTYVADGSSEGWVCDGGAVAAGTICTYEIGTLAPGERSTTDVFFVLKIDAGINRDIESIDNIVVISDDGLNGPGGVGVRTDNALITIQDPTSLDLDSEPGVGGQNSDFIFLPIVSQ